MTEATKERKRAKPREPGDEKEQKEFVGMEAVTNKKIRRLARQYKAAQRDRMSALDIEVELKEKLIAAMKDDNLETYKDKDILVTLSHGKDNIKVKTPSDDQGEDEEAAEE